MLLSKEFARNHKNRFKSLESLQASKLKSTLFATKLQVGGVGQKLHKLHFSKLLPRKNNDNVGSGKSLINE